MEYKNLISIILFFFTAILIIIVKKNKNEKEKFQSQINTLNKKYIYQTYIDKKKIPNKVYINKKKYCPEYEHIVFDDNDCKNFLLENYGREYVNIFNRLNVGAHKADFFRYCLLYIKGGVYMDIKMELIMPLDKLIKDKKIMYTNICASKKCIYQAFIYSPPRNPIFLDLIEHIKRTCNNDKKDYMIYVNYLHKYIKTNSKNKKVKPGLNKMNTCKDIYLFEEKGYNKKVCYDGNDRHGGCFFITDNNKKIVKCRYADYPWH
jgi:mannosyltransferase OCH1-like enzyme